VAVDEAGRHHRAPRVDLVPAAIAQGAPDAGDATARHADIGAVARKP